MEAPNGVAKLRNYRGPRWVATRLFTPSRARLRKKRFKRAGQQFEKVNNSAVQLRPGRALVGQKKKKREGRGRGVSVARNVREASFARSINGKNRRAVTRYYLPSARWTLSLSPLVQFSRTILLSRSMRFDGVGDFPNPTMDAVNEMARLFVARSRDNRDTFDNLLALSPARASILLSFCSIPHHESQLRKLARGYEKHTDSLCAEESC